MGRNKKYLVRQKKKKTPDGKEELTSPDVREWLCLESTGVYFKIQDMVPYRFVTKTYGLLGGGNELQERPADRLYPFWISEADFYNEYDILDELN